MKIHKRILLVIGVIIFTPVYIYMGIKWLITGDSDIEINNKIKPLVIWLDRIFFK